MSFSVYTLFNVEHSNWSEYTNDVLTSQAVDLYRVWWLRHFSLVIYRRKNVDKPSIGNHFHSPFANSSDCTRLMHQNRQFVSDIIRHNITHSIRIGNTVFRLLHHVTIRIDLKRIRFTQTHAKVWNFKNIHTIFTDFIPLDTYTATKDRGNVNDNALKLIFRLLEWNKHNSYRIKWVRCRRHHRGNDTQESRNEKK